MSSRKALLIASATAAMAVVVGALLPATTSADNFLVGANDLWKVDVNYTNWIMDNYGLFKVGDVLEFVYDSDQYNVVRVEEHDYQLCAVVLTALETWNSGDDSVLLKDAGKYYFICDFADDHCERGMKLAIEVFD